jgi:hypothetical protein
VPVGVATKTAVEGTAALIGEQARFDLLDALYRADFRATGDAVPEYLWFDLMHDPMTREQIERAREVAGKLVVPQFVIGMWSDKRYDEVTRATNQPPDITPYVEKRISRAKRAAEANPRSLMAQQGLCAMYLSAGRYEDALRFATETLARIRGPGGTAAYKDTQSQTARMEGCEYDAHYRLGHWDFVEKTVRARAELLFDGKPWNDYLFELAQFYVDSDRGAAAEMIEMLRDENSRYYTLYSLQEFKLPAQTERARVWRERFNAMIQRTDVRATLEKVGRRGKFAVPED